MADINAQGGPVLADDLMRDRSRRFVEFLDDDVSWSLQRDSQMLHADGGSG
jgi:hypothetical protein